MSKPNGASRETVAALWRLYVETVIGPEEPPTLDQRMAFWAGAGAAFRVIRQGVERLDKTRGSVVGVLAEVQAEIRAGVKDCVKAVEQTNGS